MAELLFRLVLENLNFVRKVRSVLSESLKEIVERFEDELEAICCKAAPNKLQSS